MIRAVIFDCFGVLTTDGWLAFKDKYLHDNEALEVANIANKRVDAGLISYDDFIETLASLTDMSMRDVTNVIESNHANRKLFEYIAELKSHYKIGMLSNAGDNWLDRLFLPEQNALFDEVVMSYQVGAIKPDKLMYETIADKLGVLPEECVFVDDQERYAVAAGDLGMKYVYFTDTDGAISQIREMLNA